MIRMILSICNQGTLSYSEIIETISLFFVLIGGVFALRQWYMSVKLKRAEYVKGLLDEMKTNKDIVFYKFEYDEHWYDIKFHGSGELERKIDYTLNFFSYICYLSRHRIISKNDFKCFRYEIERILTNTQFKCYCYNLFHFSRKLKQPITFYDLFKYAKKHHYFDKDFWNDKSRKYPHFLNF